MRNRSLVIARVCPSSSKCAAFWSTSESTSSLYTGSTHSHSGRRTNSRSRIKACGTVSRSLFTRLRPYVRISRSMFRGPLSIVFWRPRSFSMACKRFSSSMGSRLVSIFNALAQKLLKKKQQRSNAYLADAIQETILIFHIHGISLVQRAGLDNANFA